jgi:hypothetical protein
LGCPGRRFSQSRFEAGVARWACRTREVSSHKWVGASKRNRQVRAAAGPVAVVRAVAGPVEVDRALLFHRDPAVVDPGPLRRLNQAEGREAPAPPRDLAVQIPEPKVRARAARVVPVQTMPSGPPMDLDRALALRTRSVAQAPDRVRTEVALDPEET